MPNSVQIVSSNDSLRVGDGGAVDLDGGSIRANDVPVIPPAPNVPDGAVLTSRKSAPGGVAWGALAAANPDLAIEITDPQDGEVLVYDAKAGVWRNKRLGLSEGA